MELAVGDILRKEPQNHLVSEKDWCDLVLMASRKIREGRTNINSLFHSVGKRKILFTEKASFCFLQK